MLPISTRTITTRSITATRSQEKGCPTAIDGLRGSSLIRLLNAHFPTRTLFLGVSEACLVALAFVGATIARLGANDASIMLNYEQGLLKIIVVSVAFVTCMYYFDLYDSAILSNRREVVTR